MHPVDVSNAYHGGLVSVGFRQHIGTDLAQKVIADIGLVADGAFMKCGRGPVTTIVKVEVGKEREWIDKLVALPEIESADLVPVRYLMGCDEVMKRFGCK